MALGFGVRGDAAVAGDRIGPGVVGCECQRRIAELLKHDQQVTGRAIEVLGYVVGIDTEIVCRARHQLAEADGTDRAECARVVGALDLDVCAVEERPVRDRQTRLAKRVMAAIAQCRGLDGVEDFWGGADGPRGYSRSNLAGGSLIPIRLRGRKEKETIRLRGAIP